MSIRTSPQDEAVGTVLFDSVLQIDGDRMFAQIFGELDLATVSFLQNSLSLHAGSFRSIVYDLAGLSFIDTTGVRSLMSPFEGSCEGGEVFIRRPSKPVRRLLELLELEVLISPAEPSSSAIADLSSEQARLAFLRSGYRHRSW